MSSAAFIVAAVVIVAILIVAAWWYSTQQRSQKRQRSEQLRERFGPEYERTVAEKGDTRRAENELTARQKRVSQLNIRPLAADESQRFNDEWRAVQMSFVDDPSVAVRDADALVGRVMDARGYPEGDFEQRFADVSVDHPTALEHYRAAHEITLRHAQGQANTEDLRQAMVNDHALFTELLGEPGAVETRPDTSVPTAAR
jgi:FtsZ-interacting cell division protein ZipA